MMSKPEEILAADPLPQSLDFSLEHVREALEKNKRHGMTRAASQSQDARVERSRRLSLLVIGLAS